MKNQSAEAELAELTEAFRNLHALSHRMADVLYAVYKDRAFDYEPFDLNREFYDMSYKMQKLLK